MRIFHPLHLFGGSVSKHQLCDTRVHERGHGELEMFGERTTLHPARRHLLIDDGLPFRPGANVALVPFRKDVGNAMPFRDHQPQDGQGFGREGCVGRIDQIVDESWNVFRVLYLAPVSLRLSQRGQRPEQGLEDLVLTGEMNVDIGF